MSVNQKQMYLMLKQQLKSLTASAASAGVNDIPENFNDTGWDSTIQLVEKMLEGLKKLRSLKGNRKTPQFYRSIYNRAIISQMEIEKLEETLTTDDTKIDYGSENIKLMSEIQRVTEEKKIKDEAKAKADAEAKTKPDAEAKAKTPSGKTETK